MVSAWWLIVMFVAGGMAGILAMSLMALAADSPRQESVPPFAR